MRRRLKLLGLSILLVSLMSCNKEEWDPSQRPVKPGDMNLDFNNDQITDFKLIYREWTWDGAYTSGDMISCEFVSENENQVLVHNENGLLISNVNDTIFNRDIQPYTWENIQSEIPFVISISSSNENGWEREWSPINKEKQDFYYMSFKIFKSNIGYLGWIKIKINNQSGEIAIVDKEITDKDFIIIDR